MVTSKIQKEVAERLVFYAAKNTYNTYALALAAMETAYNTLTDAQKRNSYIVFGNFNSIAQIDSASGKLYVNKGTDIDGMTMIYFDLKNHQRTTVKLTTSNFTTTDISSNPQNVDISLYTTL